MGFGHHHMGTTRMAESENEGVVDPQLKVFGTNNFYIAGSSVFPTGGHVPPTLTITALSIRLAEHLIEELG
jgi:choline dehydrogenase-like flavoprotein